MGGVPCSNPLDLTIAGTCLYITANSIFFKYLREPWRLGPGAQEGFESPLPCNFNQEFHTVTSTKTSSSNTHIAPTITQRSEPTN
jgi:hypothetical protein